MSAFDNRYPWLTRIQHAPLSSSEKRMAQAIAKRLKDNTGLDTCFNTRTGDLFCYYRSPHGGPFSIPFYDRETRTCRRYDDSEIGDYIVLAKYGQMDPDEKAAIAERNQREEEYQHQIKKEKLFEERTPDTLDYADFKDKKRRGTNKVVSV